jgi:hypothetical protein
MFEADLGKAGPTLQYFAKAEVFSKRSAARPAARACGAYSRPSASGACPCRLCEILLTTESERFCQFGTANCIVRSDNRVVVREAPFCSVCVGRQVVLHAQMSLERFERQAALETDDAIVTNGSTHWHCRDSGDHRLRRVRQAGQCSVHVVDQAREICRRQCIVAHIRRDEPPAGRNEMVPVSQRCHSMHPNSGLVATERRDTALPPTMNSYHRRPAAVKDRTKFQEEPGRLLRMLSN